MLVVGLLLLAVAVAVGAAGVAANAGSGHQLSGGFNLFGYHLHGSAGRLYLAGLVIGAVAMLGFMMVAEGLRRDAALRRELGRFRRDARIRRRTEDTGAGKTAPVAPAPAATAPASATAEDSSAQRSARRRSLRGWRPARPRVNS